MNFSLAPLYLKAFCMEATGTPRQRMGFPGATKAQSRCCLVAVDDNCLVVSLNDQTFDIIVGSEIYAYPLQQSGACI